MTNSIRALQTKLAQDLVHFEESELAEEDLSMVEDTYEQVYLILAKLDKE